MEMQSLVTKSVIRRVVTWYICCLCCCALLFFPAPVMAEAQIEQGDLTQIREELVRKLPPQQQSSFRNTPYGWAAWSLDRMRGEALAASLTLSFMGATTVGRHALYHTLQQVIEHLPFDNTTINNHAAAIVHGYGLLIADASVDMLTSPSWLDFAYRTGINVVRWLSADRLGYFPTLGLRYLAIHGALLAETLPEMWHRGWQSQFQGMQPLICLGSSVCEAVQIQYHIDDDVTATVTTDKGWLSLTFSDTELEADESEPKNGMTQAFLDLRLHAQKLGVEKLYLYPEMVDDQLKLYVQLWQNGWPSTVLELPVQLDSDSRRVRWWTQLVQGPIKVNDLVSYEHVNPLHYEILIQLPALLAGEPVAPVAVTTVKTAATSSDGLLGFSAGNQGGVIVDSHFSQGYNIPDLYLDLNQPFDERYQQALIALAQYRVPPYQRGGSKLLVNIIRSALYRAAFEWGLKRLLKGDTGRNVGHASDHVNEQSVPDTLPCEDDILLLIDTGSVASDDTDSSTSGDSEYVTGSETGSLEGTRAEREAQVFDPDKRHILVLGQPVSGKTSFIRYLTGQEPVPTANTRHWSQSHGRIYEPMAVEGFERAVIFSESSLTTANMLGERTQLKLNSQINGADNVVWCGNIECFSRFAENQNPIAAENQQQELELFKTVMETAFAKGKKPVLVMTHADNPELRKNEGVSRLYSLVGDLSLEQLKRLYQRAMMGYHRAVDGINKDSAFLMADSREKEPALFYPELARSHMPVESPFCALPHDPPHNPPQTWWQAAVNYLRASSRSDVNNTAEPIVSVPLSTALGTVTEAAVETAVETAFEDMATAVDTALENMTTTAETAPPVAETIMAEATMVAAETMRAE